MPHQMHSLQSKSKKGFVKQLGKMVINFLRFHKTGEVQAILYRSTFLGRQKSGNSAFDFATASVFTGISSMVTFETLVPVHVTDSFLLVVLVAQCAMLAAETSSSSSVASSGMHLLEVVVLAFSSISSDFSLWKMIQQAILSHPNSQLNMKQT